MTEKSTIPWGALFDRNLWWCRMYSVAPGASCAAAMLVISRPVTLGAAARTTQGGQRGKQRNPVHQQRSGERGEHRQRRHLHQLQHHHEQHDHDRELHRLADVERAQGALRIGARPATDILPTVALPPPRSAESPARRSAMPHAHSAAVTVTPAWPSTTPSASRRAWGRSIANTLYKSRSRGS